MKVLELESALFHAFPREDAEDWDHVGLSVGDPDAEVQRVLVALDATAEDVRHAQAIQADVLLTHHPVYLSAPRAFVPHEGAYPQASAAIYEAARSGISILSYHTNLDRSLGAQQALPACLGLDRLSSLEHADDPASVGLGALADTPRMPLGELVERVSQAFSVSPRVWGDVASDVDRVAFLGGSLGDFGELALRSGADAIVCGEAGYHVCQDVSMRGLNVVLLGHDVSEYPFTSLLAQACVDAGLSRDQVVVSRVSRHWWTYAQK